MGYKSPGSRFGARCRRATVALGLAALIASTAGLGPSSAQEVADSPAASPDGEQWPVELTPDFVARSVSRDAGIPYGDALLAANDSYPIGDYVRRHWTSRDVGAVWVTFEDGYQVQIREIEGQDPGIAGELVRQLSTSEVV
ncbi:MAG TPA: hypothetical protein VJ804_15050, partial [Acidimicrobiales bacterium]|nr:hypothetical protein [Acidimicrobiales bacterium]